jgi:hypothetical protein
MKSHSYLFLAILGLLGCEQKRTPSKYLIPYDYEGVVITVYEQKGYPELPIADGFIIHEYPNDGILITSSEQEFGWASDQVFDVLEDGTYRELKTDIEVSGGIRSEHHSYTGSRSGKGIDGTIKYYFKTIGTEEYWEDRDAKEFDLKIDEAIKKLKSNKAGDDNSVTAPPPLRASP